MSDANFEHGFQRSREGVAAGEVLHDMLIPAAGAVLKGHDVFEKIAVLLKDADVTWDENAQRAATIGALTLATMLADVSMNTSELCAAITYTAMYMGEGKEPPS